MASSRVERFPVGEKINWQIGEMVGAGAFGRVYLGLNNDTGQLMAVKQVRRCSTQVLHLHVSLFCLQTGQKLLLAVSMMLICMAKVGLHIQGHPCAQSSI